MFGLRRTPPKVASQDPVRPRFQASPSSYNPFDSDTEPVSKATQKPARPTSSESSLKVPNSKRNPFDDEEGEDYWGRGPSSASSSSSSRSSSAANYRYKNRFGNNGENLENQSVEELENYAVNKAAETTKGVRNCLRIAGDIREEGTKTLEMLHQQGEQITRTHNMIVDTEKDLTKGEKLLNSLGGMFSKSWKPKSRNIQGPVIITPDNLSKKSEENMERERLGLAAMPKGKLASKTLPADATTAYQKVEVEKVKQDEALSDLSNILVDLKSMALDMGTEIDRQNKAMDHLNLDVDEMSSRVKGANQRARKLIG